MLHVSGNHRYLLPENAVMIQIALIPLTEHWYETRMREPQTYARRHL